MNERGHIPVLLNETLDLLVTDVNGIYIDGTLGGGGHSGALLQRLSGAGRIIGLDRDMDAVTRCKARFAGESRIEVHHAPFSGWESFWSAPIHGALLDLGISSYQLDEPSRGFSFDAGRADFLDMRMDRGEATSAHTYLCETDEETLGRVMWSNSDISNGKAIARAIKAELPSGDTSSNLMHRALDRVYPRGVPFKNKLLAKIFQAIRMEVNREKEEVENVLPSLTGRLVSGGRLAVITFHSVEDRWVKRKFQSEMLDCHCPPKFPVCRCGGGHARLKKVNKKPLIPSVAEAGNNPRARSAKLRVMERI